MKILLVCLLFPLSGFAAPIANFNVYKARLTEMIKVEMGLSQNKPPAHVNILDFQVGRPGNWTSLFNETFFTESYKIYLTSFPDEIAVETFFSLAKQAYNRSSQPQIPFFTHMFAMRMMDPDQGPLFRGRLLQFVAEGEGVVSMGVCCGDFTTKFYRIMGTKMVDTAWTAIWEDSSRQLLDLSIYIFREFPASSFFRIKDQIADKIRTLKKVPSEENKSRLADVTIRLERYLEPPFADNDVALAETISELSLLENDNDAYREKLFSFLVADENKWASLEAAMDALVQLPNMDTKVLEKGLEIIKSPNEAARSFFHLTEYSFPLMLKFNPATQVRLFQFYKENNDLIKEHPYYVYASFGFANPLEESVRKNLLEMYSNDKSNAAAFALGAAQVTPQLLDYHLALADQINGEYYGIFRALSRERLAEYYVNDSRVADILNSPSGSVEDLKKIIREHFRRAEHMFPPARQGQFKFLNR